MLSAKYCSDVSFGGGRVILHKLPNVEEVAAFNHVRIKNKTVCIIPSSIRDTSVGRRRIFFSNVNKAWVLGVEMQRLCQGFLREVVPYLYYCP